MASDLSIRAFYEKVCAEALPKTPLFAVSLDKYMELQKKALPFMNEPWIVRKCCDFLRDNGLKTEGIFRVPGSTSTIKKISDTFDAGQNPDFSNQAAFVEDVAGVLKKYLRDLPEPLISDGTPEDVLQKAFLQVTIEMEDEDELAAPLATINGLLKQLPKYRKAVVCDLFHLFACISSHSQFNLMTSDNVATIFGGMTDIMTSLLTSTQRSRLVRIMIDNYLVAFEGIYELEVRPEETGGKETKEGIRVYLHDGTFKSLFAQSSENSKEILKKAISKVQQTSEIDASAYHLYEIRDSIWRKIAETEKIIPIIKSGSALLMTDRLKGDHSEKPVPSVPAEVASAPSSAVSTPTAASAAAHAKLATNLITKTSSKSKKEKSPRNADGASSTSSGKDSPRSLKEGAGPSGPATPHLSAGLVSRDSSAGLARPSPRETNTPPLPFGVPLQMLLWVFPKIPAGSVKATEWDPDSTVEGHVEVKCTPAGSSILVTAGELQRRFVPTQMVAVEDSTRYFIMAHPANGIRVGLGFETREEAAKYKSLLQQLTQFDQIHAIDAEPATQPPSVSTFAAGPLGFEQKMDDGFYDTGVIPSSSTIPALRELATASIDLKAPEVILVSKDHDVRLERFVQVASKIVPPRESIEERAKCLALFVSNVFGGIDIISDGVGNTEEQDSHYATLDGISRDNIIALRTRTKSNIVKLGNVTHGVRRHRAILFKYIADRLTPSLPAALARTVPSTSSKSPSYAILIPFPSSAESYAYVDLVNEPGFAYPHNSAVTAAFAAHLCGKLPRSSPSFARQLCLSHADAVNAWYFGDAISNAPVITRETVARVFEQIGYSTDSCVYRGVLGSIPVAIKEVQSEEISDLANAQIALSHEHIISTFGCQTEGARSRVITEYLGLGSLQDQARLAIARNQPFEDSTIWGLIHEIVSGLKYLHSINKVHGNLSTSNVLLDGDAALQSFTIVKLSDALVNASRSERTSHHDSYRAPETASDSSPSPAADIWSVGAIVAELALERSLSQEELLNVIETELSSLGDFANIVKTCCNTDASKRPNIGQVESLAQEALFPPLSPHTP